MTNAAMTLERASKFPFDASDEWWETDGKNPPPADDWAHTAARGVIADLKDRHGIKHAFERIDEETRVEIVESLAGIIRAALECADPSCI